MPAYTPTTWSNGVTAVNATNMNHIEQQLGAVQYGLNVVVSAALASNDSINSGNTKTYTCVGVGGVPTGAKAVCLAYAYSSNASNTYAAFLPHGTSYSNGNYPASTPITVGGVTGNWGAFLVPLDASGKIDVFAGNGNITALYLNIYGYVY